MFPKTIALRHAEPASAFADDTAATGCGWFESSHALASGLRVTEHASPDAVAGALGLHDWIALHLALPAIAAPVRH